MTTSPLSGPKKIVDLDGCPMSEWELDLKAVHLWKNKLWTLEPFGCAICAGPDSVHATLSRKEGDEEYFHCTDHGELEAVPYKAVRTYVICIGDIERTGKEVFDDSLLFPKSLSKKDRTRIINEMLDQAEADEAEEEEEE